MEINIFTVIVTSQEPVDLHVAQHEIPMVINEFLPKIEVDNLLSSCYPQHVAFSLGTDYFYCLILLFIEKIVRFVASNLCISALSCRMV